MSETMRERLLNPDAGEWEEDAGTCATCEAPDGYPCARTCPEDDCGCSFHRMKAALLTPPAGPQSGELRERYVQEILFAAREAQLSDAIGQTREAEPFARALAERLLALASPPSGTPVAVEREPDGPRWTMRAGTAGDAGERVAMLMRTYDWCRVGWQEKGVLITYGGTAPMKEGAPGVLAAAAALALTGNSDTDLRRVNWCPAQSPDSEAAPEEAVDGWLVTFVEGLREGCVLSKDDEQRLQRVVLALRKADQHHRQARAAGTQGTGEAREARLEKWVRAVYNLPGFSGYVGERLHDEADALLFQPTREGER